MNVETLYDYAKMGL